MWLIRRVLKLHGCTVQKKMSQERRTCADINNENFILLTKKKQTEIVDLA